jgi:hypothetical protein
MLIDLGVLKFKVSDAVGRKLQLLMLMSVLMSHWCRCSVFSLYFLYCVCVCVCVRACVRACTYACRVYFWPL